MGNIVWLASYPKSGNTWVRVFLHNLLSDAAGPPQLDRLDAVVAQGEASIGWYRVADPRPPASWTPADISALRPRVHRMIAQGSDGTVFCKTHCALLRIRGHLTVDASVSARAIYILRNPLDVAISFADFQKISLDHAIEVMATEDFETPTTARNVSEIYGSWSQHVASWTTGGRGAHVVRYEDMLAAPREAFAGIVGYLGLKPAPAQLARAIRNASFDQLRKQEQQFGFAERPAHQDAFFRKGTAGQWRESLSRDQVARIVARHRDVMEQFGYVPEGM